MKKKWHYSLTTLAGFISPATCKQELEITELWNSCVFIHLPNIKEEKRATFTKKLIRSYSVNVSEFFNKRVNHVVTNLETFQKSCRLAEKQERSQLPCLQSSRAAQFLFSARKKNSSKSSSDPVQMAQAFGIKIILLETISFQFPSSKSTREQSLTTTDSARVRKLKPPFLKIEDRSRLYKPLVLEMKEWPDPEKFLLEQQPSQRATAKQAKKHKINSQYCGLCNCSFTTMAAHLDSSIHRNNAADDSKWENVDNLIRQLPTLHEFEESVLQKKRCLPT